MNNTIDIDNISKVYHTMSGEVKAIDNISFKVKDGEFIAIVGSSGCGKSTFLSILAGLDSDYKGRFNLKKKKVGYMLQTDCLLPWLSIRENCILGLKINKIKDKDYFDNVDYLIDKYKLKEFVNKKPNSLSGGMKQRVALIRTLALKPDILLLDEPFSALDYQTRLAVSDDVYKIIKSENKTAIMVTHDIAEAISMADRVIVLSKRPAKIKEIYDITLACKSNPINNRNDDNFRNFYDKIWKDLDINV